jgi:hypothetical protein
MGGRFSYLRLLTQRWLTFRSDFRGSHQQEWALSKSNGELSKPNGEVSHSRFMPLADYDLLHAPCSCEAVVLLVGRCSCGRLGWWRYRQHDRLLHQGVVQQGAPSLVAPSRLPGFPGSRFSQLFCARLTTNGTCDV